MSALSTVASRVPGSGVATSPEFKRLWNGETRRHLSRGESLTQGGKQIDAACDRNTITPATEKLRQTGKIPVLKVAG